MAISLGTIFGDIRIRLDQLKADIESSKVLLSDMQSSVQAAMSGMDEATAAGASEMGTAVEEGMATATDAVAQGQADQLAAVEGGMAAQADAVTAGMAEQASAQAGAEADMASAAEASASEQTSIWQSFAASLSGVASTVASSFQQISSAGSEMSSGMLSTELSAEKLGEGLRELAGRATEVAAGMLEFQAAMEVTRGISDFIGNMIGMNAEFEKLHAQLSSITGSGAAADKIMAWIKQFGQQVPDTTEHLAQATVTIQSLGLDATKVMPEVAKVAAAMGTDLPTAARAFSDAFEGRFMMMQNDLHVTKSQLEQFGLVLDKKGHADPGSLVAAFTKLAETKFPNALKTQMGTLNGQMSNLVDRVQFFAMALGQGLFNTIKGTLADLFGFLDSHKDQINAFAADLGGKIATAIGLVVSAFKLLINAGIAVASFIQNTPGGVAVFKAVLVGIAFAIATAVVPALWGMATAAWGVAAGVIAATWPVIAVGAAFFLAFEALKTLYEKWQPFHAAVDALRTLLGNLVGGALAGLKAAFQTIAPIVQSVGNWLRDKLGAALAFIMPYLQQAWQAVQQLGQQIGDRLSPTLKALQPVIDWLTQHWQLLVAILFPIIIPIVLIAQHWQQLMQVLKPGLVALQALWNAVWPAIGGVLNGVWNMIVGIVKVAWSLVSGIIKIGLDILTGQWGRAWQDFKDMLGGVWDGIQQFIKGQLSALLGIVTVGIRALLGPLTAIPGPIGDMARGAIGHLNDLQNALKTDTAAGGQAAVHNAAQTKVQVLMHTAQMAAQEVAQYSQMRQRILAQLAATTDPVKKAALEQQLAQVSAAMKAKEGVVTQAQKMAQGVQAAADQQTATTKKAAADTQQSTDDMAGAMQKLGATSQTTAAQLQTAIPDATAQASASTQTDWQTLNKQTQAQQATLTQNTQTTADKIKSIFDTLGTQLYTSGQNLMQMLINGINSKNGALAAAASAQAQTISNYLGHNSPAKLGPGSEADKWMPNLMAMLASTLSDSSDGLMVAAARAAGGLAAILSGVGAPASTANSPLTVPSLSAASLGAGESLLAANGSGAGDTHYHQYDTYLTVEVPDTTDTEGSDADTVGSNFGRSLGNAMAGALAQYGYNR